MLALTSFTGAPDSLDETSVLKCVLKTRCDAGARTKITGQVSVDLSHVNRRNVRHHGPASRACTNDSNTDFFPRHLKRAPVTVKFQALGSNAAGRSALRQGRRPQRAEHRASSFESISPTVHRAPFPRARVRRRWAVPDSSLG